MKAYISPREAQSRSIVRVADALAQYAPDGVSIVDDPRKADLIVFHVIGRADRTRAEIGRCEAGGQRFAIIQYCVRSTLSPHTSKWGWMWNLAQCVWSYYDLPALCAEDGTRPDFNFYHAPLGVDARVFKPTKAKKRYIVGTSGLSFMTESVREAVHAARRFDRRVFHLGPELGQGADVECHTDLTDTALAAHYGRCEYISGLRRVEGFELPAAEGLLCGARPILFERPHYRKWYDGFAEFIAEQPREGVIEDLTRLFRHNARRVSETERKHAVKQFDWKTIVKGFWERCGI